MSTKKLGLWFTLCSAAIGIAATFAGVFIAVTGETPRDERLVRILLGFFPMDPGLHNFIRIGFVLVMNAVVIAALCWMTLWSCSVALTLLRRLRKAP